MTIFVMNFVLQCHIALLQSSILGGGSAEHIHSPVGDRCVLPLPVLPLLVILYHILLFTNLAKQGVVRAVLVVTLSPKPDAD